MTSTALKKFRARLGLTQRALAARLGVDRHTVKRWEMGTRAISPMAVKLLQTLRPS